MRVAARLAEEGRDTGDPDRVLSLMQQYGEPHLRPRILSVRPALDADALRRRLGAEIHESTRCGSARAPNADRVVAVMVDALADLEPLPTRARTGQWLTLRASLHIPVRRATLVVMGPRGLPRTVPTSLDRASNRAQARFVLDQPGAFTVQLVAEIEGGPQPVLEARVFADVEPSSAAANAPAPGEEASSAACPGAGVTACSSHALAMMVDAVRSLESLPLLRRDARLDVLAQEHAEKMRDRGQIAHDVGYGDLTVRFEATGMSATIIGENVARARSVALAHRALYASPSHRMNLLRAEHTHVGIGLATNEAGMVYACQVFAGRLDP
jgi:uncharacterized protein YkwD